VLALTFMHGSRLRLIDRLGHSSVRSLYECSTFDRFAWQLCRRWRTRVRTTVTSLFDSKGPVDYDATCVAAASLLEAEDVARWVAACHPVVLVDEFQDCKGGRLAIVKQLARHSVLLVAADEFQDLGSIGPNSALEWLRSAGQVEDLPTVHRTHTQGLLDAARALRESRPLADGSGFKLIARPAPGPVASYISQLLVGSPRSAAVVLSPVLPRTSPFVRDVVEFVSTKQYGDRKVGPFKIAWEETAESLENATLDSLNIRETSDDTSVPASMLVAVDRGPLDRALVRWVQHRISVRGQHDFRAGEVRLQVRRVAQRIRLLSRMTPARRAMTIHQAKNREFSIVIVLWPLQVRSDPDAARRLLYNAITRAKDRALVFVQDTRGERLRRPPFA